MPFSFYSPSRLKPLFFFLALFISGLKFLSAAELSAFFRAAPEIENLSHRDPLFRQYSEDVKNARIALAADTHLETIAGQISFYRYKAKDDDDLLSLAARCSIPYESIATLNRIENAGDSLAGKTLILPSMPGLYVPSSAPENAFEELLAASLADSAADEGIKIGNGSGVFFLFPGRRLEGTARTFFLVAAMRFPLPEGVLTSAFGSRVNPVTGNRVFHRGIDIAAPEGTPVYACANGTVIESGFSKIYGNYIIIAHSNGMESLYGHLSEKKIKLHDRIKSGTIIGNVGSTGQSTGSHLHFEIHENGIPRDPEGLLR